MSDFGGTKYLIAIQKRSHIMDITHEIETELLDHYPTREDLNLILSTRDYKLIAISEIKEGLYP
jgi:hypothetical protein